MTDWTTARVTPETLAELRRLLEEATPGPWHAWDRGIGYEVHTEAEHNPIHCVSLNSEFRETFRGPDARLIAAAVNALPALLDAAAERDRLAEAVERVRALATEWATQPNDYHEDTEQQIEDGGTILPALDGGSDR